MSEKHLYEKHLAEKLQQLPPPPDREQHWQEMKALLDDEMPRGGGRWWRYVVMAALLLMGGWFTATQWSAHKGPDGAAVAQSSGQTGTIDGNSAVARPRSGPVHSETSGDAPSVDGNTGQANAGQGQLTGTEPAETEDETPDQGLLAGNKPAAGGETTGDYTPANKVHNSSPDKHVIPPRTEAGTAMNDKPGNTKNNNKGKRTSNLNEVTLHSNNKPANPNRKNTSPAAEAAGKKTATYSPLRERVNYTGSLTLAPAENLKTNFSSLDLKVIHKRSSKSARSGKSRQAGSLAFGISLPLAFPLGDQQALGYNFNAGANTVSDYIPAPHVQYHFNDKTYLQTEVQVMSPQFIRPILMYQHKTPQSGYYIYNSVYARKLYYFNIPIGIHHSPFENFYLGTGLQFSSLLSGVALYEETKRNMNGQQTALLSERYSRLNGDSLSNRMNTAELRLMLDVNYYFNRFTVGLRYSQAFNNYVSFQVDNTSPYTFDKNKALQFYLRYNLWEGVRPKTNKTKGLLSSK